MVIHLSTPRGASTHRIQDNELHEQGLWFHWVEQDIVRTMSYYGVRVYLHHVIRRQYGNVYQGRLGRTRSPV